MKYNEFLASVGAYLVDTELVIQIPGFIRTARLRLQRKFDWNFTRADIRLDYPSTENVGVVLPPTFKSFAGSNAVKVVDADLIPTAILTGSSLEKEYRRSSSSEQIRYYVKYAAASTIRLFTNPEQLGAILLVDCYSWLPDYSGVNDEDIFLLYGHDVLLWETLKVANMFLAEEEKVPINAQLAEAALSEFQSWDNQIGLSGSWIDVS